MKKHVFLTLFLFIAFSLSAQNFNISSTSVNINCTTGGTLYDSGGSTGTYANNQNFVFTVCPGSPGFGVFANMTTMAIAQGDVLNIYNGNSTAAPLFPDMPLDQNTAYALGAQFQASVTNPTGCLTFEFISNNDGQNGNFVFGLTCNPRCQEFYSNIAFSIPDTTLTATDTYIDVCLGDTVFVTATDSFPQNNTEYAQSNATSTFQWFWDLGTNVPDLGISQSHYYDAPGGYIARLISYDVNGCRNTQDKLFKVRVAPIPLFVDLTDSILCLGQSDTLTGLPQGTIINGQIVQGDTVYFVPPFYSGDSTFLPDGNGAVYSSPAVLSGFDQGALIENCGDILEVCINMEHSYLGDLNIALVCPNGQSVTLKAYPGGGGTFLGNPYDNGTQALGPGSGLDYCFSGTSTNGLLVNGPTQAATLEPGNTIVPNTYQPVTPFTNLIGCPINGLWQLQITDNLTIDDGYIFNWSLDIHPCMYPEVDSFIMVYDLGYWDSDPTITGIVNDSNTITIQPSTLGSYAYTYHTQNQFGCLYDHTYDIFVDGFTVNATPSDTTVCAGDPVPLVANVAGSVSSCNYSLQLTDTWGDGWNGATLTVLFNGVVFNAYTIATGSSATYNFSAPGGTVVSFNMTGGTFPNEVIYSISTNGSVIYSSGPNPTVGNNVFSTTCGGYYTYNWSPPTNLSSATIQNPIATVSTGTVNYTVAVTNINGCTYYDTATVNNSSSFQFAAYGDTIICAGDTAQLFATGGALSYIWTPNNSTISDTSAASPYVYPTSTTTYTVQADSTGCSQFENIVVQVSNIQVINYIVTPATCGLSNGGLIIFANGGISPLTFSKNGGLTTQANGFFQNLAGGTYHIQITDNSNCPLDTFITIPGGSAPVIDTILTNNPTCGNVNDGTIQIILTDTLSTFTYVNTTTSTTQTNNLFTGLAGNTYNFTITGAGCPPIDTMVTLSQPTPLVLALDTAINVSCFNALDGQIVLETTGGAPIYSYSIDGVNFQLANTFNALDSGTYTFIVQDNNTCFDTLVASITAPDALLLSNIAITDAACFGANGFIQFEAQGGTAPYLFSINGGTSYSAADSFNVPAGNYTLQVQDNNNCLSNVVLDTIVQPSLLTVVLDSTHNANCGVSDGGVYVSVNGGTLPYTYSWSDGAIVVGNTEDLNLINAGIYTLIAYVLLR